MVSRYKLFLKFQIDKNCDGYIDLAELKDALEVCGFKLPGWKVRQMVEDFDRKYPSVHQGSLSFDEFEKVLSVNMTKA
ncbi:hypothetical protein PR048_011549 [Dryococelus australis]|uniref:EF-hand domain-containing protein n=1 Tax=Dryococelus australis TaxID=614101 RepID=A0ABQ9HM80_9NEOP|nr:hypothetical protein PR048_011549 [Dryococelus australis]